ncbi:Copper homeostasis CutC domain protein [Cordyceps fumosorosea ARSEF 2679]|uniref:Copper homeostasis protein cutC homolog n=1 Tax=Cordyceps fumosorosea (strain ARSEF 2679) TaxID=1081104 RepID=A0A162MSA8_CORFA|nr:Copper homeostasis CutC domain protein [Cordyceps fumosorosea ARSEF 2679]OAA66150.1 Copper homeostasis CutC domain protein [Cordyceps fumosorosea ARSEF 2679]
MAPVPLEVAVFSVADALLSASLGASRIELNHPGSYPLGGLTPPASALSALSDLPIPVRVMIRPRGPPPPPDRTPDFIYTAAEVDAMHAAIAQLKPAMDARRGDGFVFGALTRDGRAVEEQVCAALVAGAAPFACVFHRAFDGLADLQGGVEVLGRCGFAGVLTAGGARGGAPENVQKLGEVCEAARRKGGLEVVAGGGVRHGNVATVVRGRGGAAPGWVHSAALKPDGTGLDEDELRRLLAALAREDEA